jgi:hypothetical protein
MLSFATKLFSLSRGAKLRRALSAWRYAATHTIPERIVTSQSFLAIRAFERSFVKNGMGEGFRRWKLRAWAVKSRGEGNSKGIRRLCVLARRWGEGRLRRGLGIWRQVRKFMTPSDGRTGVHVAIILTHYPDPDPEPSTLAAEGDDGRGAGGGR